MVEQEKADAAYCPIDILLVEDNQADAKITMRAFSQAKIKNNVYLVPNGKEALEFIHNQGEYADKTKCPRPDLILLDINMPVMNGFEFLKELKKDQEFSFIPVIMLTSSKTDEDVIKSYGIGACSYIPKPVAYGDFAKAVDGFNFYWHIINRLPDGKRNIK